MSLESRTRLYEVLVRFGPEGLSGAHAIDIEEIYDSETGVVRSATQLPARAIEAAEAEEVLGPALVEAANQLDAREKEFNEHKINAEQELLTKQAEVEKALQVHCAEAEKELNELRAGVLEQRDKLASVAAAVMSSI